MSHFEILEHTADVGLDVKASSIKELFTTAAHGMFSILCPSCRIVSQEMRSVEVCGEDTAELLVNWLSELNYLCQVRQFLFARVVTMEIKENGLIAKVMGEKINPIQHKIHTEIKAVTYHKLFAGQNSSGGWQAQVYFDL